jgi:hypothetical protein
MILNDIYIENKNGDLSHKNIALNKVNSKVEHAESEFSNNNNNLS